MGDTYVLMNGDHWMVLSFYEKARQILETNGASNNPNLATVYSHIGKTYHMKEEYWSAVSTFEKALEIQKQSLLPGHLDMSHTYAGMARVFYDLQDDQQALKYLKLDIEIARQDKTSAGANALKIFLNLFTEKRATRRFRD
jgi:tetratricopeptide (TPR) repeat protein